MSNYNPKAPIPALTAATSSNVFFLPTAASEPFINQPRKGQLPKAIPHIMAARRKKTAAKWQRGIEADELREKIRCGEATAKLIEAALNGLKQQLASQL